VKCEYIRDKIYVMYLIYARLLLKILVIVRISKNNTIKFFMGQNTDTLKFDEF